MTINAKDDMIKLKQEKNTQNITFSINGILLKNLI